MSTKIYYGYKINLPAYEVLSLLARFHKELENSEWYNQQIDLSCVWYVVNRTIKMFGLPIDRSKIRNEFIKLWDYFKYSIAIIPKENHTLAIVYTADQSIDKKFLQLSEVEYYGYWNNTDPPEDISAEEWEARREEWRCLSYGIPVCKEALIWKPFTDYEFPLIGALADSSYDPDEIRLRVAKFLKKELSLDIPAWKLKWKIPLLTKEVLFSDLRLPSLALQDLSKSGKA